MSIIQNNMLLILFKSAIFFFTLYINKMINSDFASGIFFTINDAFN